MAIIVKDRVKQQTTTTGTGTYTLSGSFDSFQTFAEIGDGNTTYYCCTDGTDFEIGRGAFTASGTTLSREEILSSSNSGAKVNWSAGTRTIFCTQPADRTLYLNNERQVMDTSSANAANLKLQSNGTDGVLDIAGGGPNFIRFRDGSDYSTMANAIDVVYRTTPNNLLIERAENSNIIAEFGGDDGHAKLLYDGSDRIETTSTGTTLDGDVTFTGDSYNVVWDKSDNALEFGDDAKAVFGDSGDLRIYHGSDRSVIEDIGTGRLLIKTNDLDLTNAAGSEKLIKAYENGAIELYYDGSKKLETTSAGATVTGTLTSGGVFSNGSISDSQSAKGVYIGLSGSGDAQVSLVGDNTDASPQIDFSHDVNVDYDVRLILEDNGNRLAIKSHNGSSAENMARFVSDGAVELYYDAVKKFETTADGVTITSTDDGADEKPTLKLFRDSSSPADSDEIGEIEFVGKNDAAEDVTYTRIFTSILDASDGTEDCRLEFKGLTGGAETTYLQMKGGVNSFNRDIALGTTRDLKFEGATSNDFETTVTVTDPTADRTITLPDATGQVVLSDGAIDTDASAEIGRAHIGYIGFGDYAGFSHVDANTTTNYALIQHNSGYTYLNAASGADILFRIANADTMTMDEVGLHFKADKVITFEGSTNDTNETTLTVTDPTADRTITLPDATGTVALENGNAVLLNTTTVSSGVSSVDFGSSLITDDFDNYLLVVEDLTVSAATGIRLRLGTANSADATASIYNQNVQWRGRALTSTTNNTQNFSAGGISASAIIMGGSNQDVGTAATQSANFTLQLQNLRSTTFHKTISGVTGSCYMTDISGTNSGVTYVCSLRDLQFNYLNTAAVNFLTIYEEDVSSQISGGTFSLYGLKT